MIKKVVLASSLLLVAGCRNGAKEASSSSVSETEESVSSMSMEESESVEIDSVSSEESESVATTPGTHVFSEMITQNTFSNEHGYEAWEVYQTVIENYQLSDYMDPADTTGSTVDEIDALFDPAIMREEVDISEEQKMVLYRFPDEEGGEFSEISMFLSEIAFYFLNDHLVFSSITPGFYEVSLTDAEEFDVLGNLYTVEELVALEPQVFTVSEVKVEGEVLRQTMVPAQPLPDQTDVMLNAMYFFVSGEDILHYSVVPFEQVSQDFPTNSILIFNSYFNWLQEGNG